MTKIIELSSILQHPQLRKEDRPTKSWSSRIQDSQPGHCRTFPTWYSI